MRRSFDVIFSLVGMIVLSPVMLVLCTIGLFDTGSPIFKQTRMGKNKQPFTLYKFRTMLVDTQHMPTHLSDASAITPFGHFLRRTKLDELPQLLNVLKGDMSLVGPRPNLFNQPVVIAEREKRNVYTSTPGITGLAQINEIDMSTPGLLAEKDAEMLHNLNLGSYFKYIFATITGKGQGDRVRR